MQFNRERHNNFDKFIENEIKSNQLNFHYLRDL